MTNITDELIKATSLLNRVNSDTYDTLVERLDNAQALINAEIMKYDTLTPKLKKFINDTINTVYEDFDSLMIKDIEDVVEVAYDKVGLIMGAVAGVEVLKYKNAKDSVKKRLVNPNKPILGNNLKEEKANLIYSQNKRLRQVIADGFESDLSLQQIQRQARASENANDLFAKIKRNEINTITRTALLSNIEDAKVEAMEVFEKEDWFLGWEYLSVLDTRTSDYCKIADGYVTKDKSKAKYAPKSHYNCRSTWKPITAYDEVTERPSTIWDSKMVNHRDGSKSTKFKVKDTELVSSNLKYMEWYKQLPKEDKILIMGKQRVELIESGKISLKDATKLQNNTFIPIKELKKQLDL